MIRCPRCGLRVDPGHPVCTRHGALQADDANFSLSTRNEQDHGSGSFADALLKLGYRVDGLLGIGGFGSVHGALRTSDRLLVAIKVAGAGDLHGASLMREAAALRMIGPPNVPILFELGLVEDRRYLVIERIDSQTLAQVLLAQAGPMPLDRFEVVAHALLHAVETVHRHGIVHRDLKPENIFLEGSTVRLIDFGLATGSHWTDAAPQQEDVGTAEYMSPEQCEGSSDIDRRSDIYSLGALFYELLTGAPPFWGTTADVREAQRSQRPPPVSLRAPCPFELDQVVRRCLAKDRERRFEDVRALRVALAAALARGPISTRPSLRPVSAQSGRPVALGPIPRSAASREKSTVGLVRLESRAGVGAVQSAVQTAGGQLVHIEGFHYVAAFGCEVGENPVRIAVAAAQRMLSGRLSSHFLIDVAAVSIQLRPDGSRRILGASLTRKETLPTAADPPGVILSAAAAEVLPDVPLTRLEGTPDRFALEGPSNASESYTVGTRFSPLIGRDEVLQSILDSGSRALSQRQPTVVTVIGDGGLGKTYLAGVAVQRFRQLAPGANIIRLAAQESAIGSGAQLLPDLIRRIVTLPDEPPDDGGHVLLMNRLEEPLAKQTWAAVALMLGWIDVSHPEVARLAAAPGALRLAQVRAVGELMRRSAAHKPLMIVVDDAHLADEAALDALEYATLGEAGAAIWVCVLVRPAFLSMRKTWANRAAHSATAVLEPLSHEAAMEVARELLKPVEYVPSAVLTRLAERTRGIPRLLVELVRGLKREGIVRRSERGTGYYLATEELDKLPDLPIVQWNARREIQTLPSQLIGHARLAAVLGGSFSILEIESLLSILERDPLPDDMQLDGQVGVERLAKAGILIRHRDGSIDFRHTLLREIVYDLIPEAQRTSLHRAAFAMYRGLELADERRLPRIAYHAARSGQKAIAADAYLELAQRAMHRHAYLDAESAFSHVLEEQAPSGQVMVAARGRGLMRFRLGRHHEALKDLRHASDCAKTLNAHELELEGLLDEATVLDWTRDFGQGAAVVQRVRDASGPHSELIEARIAMALARISHRLGDSEASVRLGSEATTKAEALGDAGYETLVIALLLMAADCASLGQLEHAERHLDRAIREADARGDMHHLGVAYVNRAVLGYARKDVAQLLRDLGHAIRIAREIGEPLHEYNAVYNLGEVAYAIEDLDRAREHAQRALLLANQLWGAASRELSTCELLLARISLYGGNLSAARTLVASIRERVRLASASAPQEAELVASDEALLEMVDLSSRERDDPHAWHSFMARVQRIDMQPLEEIEILESYICMLIRSGSADRSELEQALDACNAKPNLLSDRLSRRLRTFLTTSSEPARRAHGT
jgi:tetratricopeptide (TPR) repeat protein